MLRSRTALAGRPGGTTWHLGLPGRTGTLELNGWQGRVWLRVASNRAAAWVERVAEELGRLGPPEDEG